MFPIMRGILISAKDSHLGGISLPRHIFLTTIKALTKLYGTLRNDIKVHKNKDTLLALVKSRTPGKCIPITRGAGVIYQPHTGEALEWLNEGYWNGALRFASSRVPFPSLQPQGVCYVSTSAAREAHSPCYLREFTDLHNVEEDLDDYMKSQYDDDDGNSLKRSNNNKEAESSEEELMDPQQLEEDPLWRLKPNKRGKFDNVVAAVLADPQVLAAAHKRLNERRRNWTLASNELEVSHVPKENRLLWSSCEIDWSWFKEAAQLLRMGSYPFKPAERREIARRGRGEMKQWVFVRPKDQVIQEAMRGVLERIYAPLHQEHLRPGANVHSALKSVKYGWKGVSWFLQFDVRIRDHASVQQRLLSTLADKIEDEAFFALLRRMFQLGTLWVDTGADEDMPEGSVLSPMLGNIYFHRLDLEMGRIQEEISRGGS